MYYKNRAKKYNRYEIKTQTNLSEKLSNCSPVFN